MHADNYQTNHPEHEADETAHDNDTREELPLVDEPEHDEDEGEGERCRCDPIWEIPIPKAQLAHSL